MSDSPLESDRHHRSCTLRSEPMRPQDTCRYARAFSRAFGNRRRITTSLNERMLSSRCRRVLRIRIPEPSTRDRSEDRSRGFACYGCAVPTKPAEHRSQIPLPALDPEPRPKVRDSRCASAYRRSHIRTHRLMPRFPHTRQNRERRTETGSPAPKVALLQSCPASLFPGGTVAGRHSCRAANVQRA